MGSGNPSRCIRDFCSGASNGKTRKVKGLLKRLQIVLEMVKIEHTIFALPFAFFGAFLAARGIPRPAQIGWILLAMVGARSAAMAFNRLVDLPFDARNPRTLNRASQRAGYAQFCSRICICQFGRTGIGRIQPESLIPGIESGGTWNSLFLFLYKKVHLVNSHFSRYFTGVCPYRRVDSAAGIDLAFSPHSWTCSGPLGCGLRCDLLMPGCGIRQPGNALLDSKRLVWLQLCGCRLRFTS